MAGMWCCTSSHTNLDGETGSTDGAPLLGGASSYRIWAGVLSEEFAELRDDSRRGHRSLLDHYGAQQSGRILRGSDRNIF